MSEFQYQILSAEQAAAETPALYRVLQACVAEGASIGFVSLETSPMQHFWHGVIANLASGERRLIVARQQGEIVATVMVVLDMMPNGSHRAEIAKLLVHPTARRQGVARTLLCQAERLARQEGRTLLVLDTRTGDIAGQLYLSQGWQIAGQIPQYARSTKGVLDATTLMYKVVGENDDSDQGGHHRC